jgi:hypothetical protein
MVKYFYAWTPFVIVGTVVLLTLPYLGLFALLVVLLLPLVALASLAWAVVFVSSMLSRAASGRWHSSSAASPATAAALAPARRQNA